VQALLDKARELDTEKERHEKAEEDRARRLLVIEEQGRRLGEIEAERNILLAEVATRRQQMEVIEADRAARLAVIEEQGRRLGEIEADRNALRNELGQVKAEGKAERAALQLVRGSRAYRILRALGRWKFIERAGADSAGSPGRPP
jgi:uncharacterized protein (DUF3084 family)